MLESFGLIQSVRGLTHNGGHTLELVITRSDHPAPVIRVDPPKISDHSVVFADLLLQRPPIRLIDVDTRAWKNFDADKFRSDLLCSQLCSSVDGLSDLSVDEIQEIYDTTLSSLLNKHAPKRRMRRRYQPLVHWFDSECSAAR